MANVLHLVAPGLLEPFSHTAEPVSPHCPALERLLRRARTQPILAGESDALLFKLFGLTPDAERDLPVAAVSRLADGGEADNGWWLRADPVNVQADLRQVLLFDAGEIDAAEAQTLVEAINQTFGGDGLRLEARHPRRWYLRMAEAPGLRTQPLAAALGGDIDPRLPEGAAGRRWRGLLTEIQMLLHDHPVNREREDRGQPIINSLWFWGGGVLPTVTSAAADVVYAGDPLARGLARLAGVALSGPLASASEWRDATEDGETSLVVLDADRHAAVDSSAWPARVNALESTWFEPCWDLLKGNVLTALHLYLCPDVVYTLTRREARRFWRRPRPLTHYRARS